MKRHSLQTEIETALNISLPSKTQKIVWPRYNDDEHNNTHHRNRDVWVKRDDLIHPIISGNKWRKLSPIITQAIKENWRHVASFGGGYSNHLHALGYVCNKLNIQCTAIIRGDYSKHTTPMIDDLLRWNSHIIYVNKLEYARRNEHEYIQTLENKLHANAVIPEGGTSADTLSGVASIIDELQSIANISNLLLPVGSGGTMAGLIHAINHKYTKAGNLMHVHGISVLKGKGYHDELIRSLLHNDKHSNFWRVHEEFHHGGYAKVSETLLNFSEFFTQKTGIDLDSVYNAKSFYALNQLLKDDTFKDNTKVCILHTGGMQGNRKK